MTEGYLYTLLALLGFSALNVLVFGKLGTRPERIIERLDGPTRDQHAPADATTDKPPLRNPVLDGLRADTDESSCLTGRHVPGQSCARIWRDQRLLHQALDGDRRALVMLSAQPGD